MNTSFVKRMALLGGMLVTSASFGQTIYCVTDGAGFGTMSTAGVYNQIGTTHYVTGAPLVFGDIEVDSSGNVYGTTYDGNHGLWQINTATAACTFVGTVGFDTAGGTFGSDGFIYADDTAGNLYKINPVTAGATLVGAMGFTTDGDFQFLGGQLYMTGGFGNFYTVNTTNGAATLVGNYSASTGGANLFGLANVGGTMYALSSNSGLFSLNLGSGAATLVNPYSGSAITNVIYGSDVRVVPEPSTLLLLAGGLALRLRRKKAAH